LVIRNYLSLRLYSDKGKRGNFRKKNVKDFELCLEDYCIFLYFGV
jgi:hypothetical protein